MFFYARKYWKSIFSLLVRTNFSKKCTPATEIETLNSHQNAKTY